MDFTSLGLLWLVNSSLKQSTLIGVVISKSWGLEWIVLTAVELLYSSRGMDRTGSAVRDHWAVELRVSSSSSHSRPQV